MANLIFITDIFGNSIQVTDLEKSISQTKQFIHMSKQNNIIFTEYYFENTTDTHGRQIKVKRTPKKPKEVNSLDFYNHQLKQLLKLK